MKVAVLGATGMLGHQVYLKARDEGHQTFALIRKSKAQVSSYGFFSDNDLVPQIDFLDSDLLFRTLVSLQPDVVINCSGVTTRKLKRSDIAQVIEMNSVLPQKLALWCEQQRCRFFHISTDCVFDGKSAPYLESTPFTAKDLYGMSKALGEVKDSPNTLTLRCSIFGPELEAKTELFEWLRSQAGKEVQGFSNVIYSGVSTLFLASTLIQLLRDFPNLHGLYQVASEPISKFELLEMIQSEFALKIQVLENKEAISNKTLVSQAFEKATGIKPPSWTHQIQQILKQETLLQHELRRA